MSIVESVFNPEKFWDPSNSERPNYPEQPKVEDLRELVNQRFNLKLKNFWDLHRFSTERPTDFWNTAWDFGGVIGDRGNDNVVFDPNTPMDQPQKWFPAARLNFAENLLLGHKSARSTSKLALVSCGEPEKNTTNPVVYTKYTYAELYDRVNDLASTLRDMGLKPGDRVASFAASSAEMIIAFLAASTIGCPYSCAPVEFGLNAVLDRFTQTKPKVLFSIDETVYGGKQIKVFPLLSQIIEHLSSSGLENVVVLSHRRLSREPSQGDLNDLKSKVPSSIKVSTWNQAIARGSKLAPKEIQFFRAPFSYPLQIVFSSGTTGKPKAMVHSAGGSLLPRKIVNYCHLNIDHRDTMLQFATLGWIVYNVNVAALCVGPTLLLYDGSPLRPRNVLWDLVEKFKATTMGISPGYMGTLNRANYNVRKLHDVRSLKLISITGAPVTEDVYNYLNTKVKPEGIFLFNTIGGTDIAGSFSSGCPSLPHYKNEISAPVLGIKVESLDDNGKIIRDKPGSMCILQAFPNQPIHFLNDPGNKRYHSSYFEDFTDPICWSQQDSVIISSKTGGMIMLGRIDGVLNPGGVRFGSAEIYNVVDTMPEYFADSICVGQAIGNDERVLLFVKMKEGVKFSKECLDKLKVAIESKLSRRHVPAIILPIPDIPTTTSGKKVETLVKKVIKGKKASEVGGNTISNPAALAWFETVPEIKLDSIKAKL